MNIAEVVIPYLEECNAHSVHQVIHACRGRAGGRTSLESALTLELHTKLYSNIARCMTPDGFITHSNPHVSPSQTRSDGSGRWRKSCRTPWQTLGDSCDTSCPSAGPGDKESAQ